MKLYRIKTSDKKRRALWYRLFGMETLPVKSHNPRRCELPGKSILAYDLDASRLSSGAVDTFAHYIAHKYCIPFSEARSKVDGWHIQAHGCTAIEDSRTQATAVPPSWIERPFFNISDLALTMSYS